MTEISQLAKPTLGVAIITKNAAAHFEKCLAAAKAVADDIVVIDSGSTDGTPDIARSHGARVFVDADWPGFGPQKNRALDQLATDWVLSLDADEVLTDELAHSIRQAVASGEDAVFSLSRLSNLCGRWMRYSGWRPDHVARLFRRGRARFSDDLVHERLVFEGEPLLLSGELLHYSFDDLDEVVDKMNRYSSAGAQQRFARGKRGGSMASVIAKACWSFCRTYLLRRGFLDGREGFVIAVANAEGTFYRQLKLLYLSEREKR
ncbi:glycosyltransferase family 2 protein [Chromobacterium sp. IIBBL 290-4]|uniref:glycosyltransferase family 2 protein n=1 Tax=Chromobacterium sp. IIBBL 290-4 TaxID=2953890 RepID=UPI0020B7CD4A|nr:glycosyltransferase family 2 protein [Chromobacterium sp. IIBBL 290-4]UTH75287.1 glycosyltransferase family 2 protein [Chromobacterium sp. IIBBL 290-4]